MGNASASKHGAMGWADDEPGQEKAAEHTPTMDEMRGDHIHCHTRNFDSYMVGRSLESEQELYGAEFDRTMAAHDAEVAAKARREAIQEVRELAVAEAIRRNNEAVSGSNTEWAITQVAVTALQAFGLSLRALIAAPTTPEGEQDA